jgi:hypothetical protein
MEYPVFSVGDRVVPLYKSPGAPSSLNRATLGVITGVAQERQGRSLEQVTVRFDAVDYEGVYSGWGLVKVRDLVDTLEAWCKLYRALLEAPEVTPEAEDVH